MSEHIEQGKLEAFAKDCYEICHYPDPTKWEELSQDERDRWIMNAEIILDKVPECKHPQDSRLECKWESTGGGSRCPAAHNSRGEIKPFQFTDFLPILIKYKNNELSGKQFYEEIMSIVSSAQALISLDATVNEINHTIWRVDEAMPLGLRMKISEHLYRKFAPKAQPEVASIKKIEAVIKKTLAASCSCNNGDGIVCVGCFYRNDLAKAIHSLLTTGRGGKEIT